MKPVRVCNSPASFKVEMSSDRGLLLLRVSGWYGSFIASIVEELLSLAGRWLPSTLPHNMVSVWQRSCPASRACLVLRCAGE